MKCEMNYLDKVQEIHPIDLVTILYELMFMMLESDFIK